MYNTYSTEKNGMRERSHVGSNISNRKFPPSVPPSMRASNRDAHLASALNGSPTERIHLDASGYDPEQGSGIPLDVKVSYSPVMDTRQTMKDFDQFMRILIIISTVCIFFSWISLSGAGIYVTTFSLMICIGSFLFCSFLVRWIMVHDAGTTEMRVISDAIKEGAEGFLSTQYSSIATMAAFVALALFLIYYFRTQPPSQHISAFTMAFATSVSFLSGAFCSALAGYIGVWISVRVNIRVASAAARFSYPDAMKLAFRGGAVSSMLSASMCILGISVLYVLLSFFLVSLSSSPLPSQHIPMLLAGYGFGASFVALFMQLGGGIYTKAADVGADMVGKVEKDIPEDDPRNPAVIADLVGDNVGDCAGSMADVFESIAAEMIGTMILGGTLAKDSQIEGIEGFIFFPLMVHTLDLVVSGIGIVLVRSNSPSEDPLVSMKRAYSICMAIAVVAFVLTTRIMLYTPKAPSAWWMYSLCGIVGIVCSYLLVSITQYYTDYNCSPVKKIAAASQTGHGTNIISGISVGMESTGLPSIVIAVSLLVSYYLGAASGLDGMNAGVFGAACATMGMLCTAVFILSMNNFGPIADNAGGIVEMSEQPDEVRIITDRLDAVGNVTKAATKGYAVGGSALACYVLFQAFLDEINQVSSKPFRVVDITKVEVLVGGLLGIALVFLFTGWAIDAVGQTAQKVVWEVRRQFKEKPGIMTRTERPEYGTCVRIVTKAALREMIRPALLALLSPVIVGFIFKWIGSYTDQEMIGVEVVASMLLFGTLTGLLMAMFLDNSGGAWDNAKKLIEASGGRGTESHKAAVTGDTVGDPFKDTAGPALHVIITTMSTTALVLGPMFISNLKQASDAAL